MISRRSRKDIKEDTRRSFLDAGVRLLSEGGPVGDVRHQLPVKRVAERAGKSGGAFYQHFGSHEAYVDAVLDHALSVEHLDQVQRPTLEFITHLLETGAATEEVARRGAKLSFHRGVSNEGLAGFLLQLGLLARGEVDEEGRRRVQSMYRDLTARYLEFYERMLLPQLGRRMREGYTLHQLAITVTAVFDGLSVRRLADPESVRDYDAGADLAAEATLNLVRTMTEPIAGDEGCDSYASSSA